MKTLATVACALAVAVGASACNRDTATDRDNDVSMSERSGPGAMNETFGTQGGEATTGREGTVDIADLMENPRAYMGRTVTVVADLEEAYGPNAFTLDEDALLRGGIDRDLLVLGRSGTLAQIDDQWLNNKVRVTGTVGVMSVVEVERELGLDLDRQIEVEVERAGAILIANSVERVEGQQGWSDQQNQHGQSDQQQRQNQNQNQNRRGY